MAEWDRVDCDAVLLRDRNDEVSAEVKRSFRSEERAVVIIPGKPGAIIATNERVLMDRPGQRPAELMYSDLDGADSHLPLIGRASVTLTGPNLVVPATPIGGFQSAYSTSPGFWSRSRASDAVRELNALIDNQNGWTDPPNRLHTGFLAGGWRLSRNWGGSGTQHGGK